MAPISEHTYHRQVQFPETDASGIVHFTNFFKYVEEAEHAMWRATGLSIAAMDAEVSWPRVAASPAATTSWPKASHALQLVLTFIKRLALCPLRANNAQSRRTIAP